MSTLALAYDLRDDYLAMGFGEEETAEFDKADTIDALEAALQASGYDTVRVGNAYALVAALHEGRRWEGVFNICEGLYGYGRESLVPALLDHYRIPYVFSEPLCLASTLQKEVAKRLVRAHGVLTPDFALVTTLEDLDRLTLPPFPLFAKPVAEGTGKGIASSCLVRTMPQLGERCARLLTEHRQPVLVERYLPGREATVGIVGTGQAARVLGAMEVLFGEQADQACYSYRNKEEYEELMSYRRLEGPALQDAAAVALQAYNALGLRDAGRVDVRQDETGRFQFMEVNPLPGLHPKHSDLPILCALHGMPYQALIEHIMSSAAPRMGLAPQLRTAA